MSIEGHHRDSKAEEKCWIQQAGARRSDRELQVTISATGSCRVGFVAEALVVFPSSLKSLRKGLFHRGPWILPLQFFQVARHLGRDLIKLFAAISGVQSRFEAQEVEFLAVSEVLARFEIVLQGCVHGHLVFVHHVLLTPASNAPRLFSSNCIDSRRGLTREGFDRAHVFISESKLAGAHHSFCLLCIAGANNGSCDGGVV